ncbi:MAG: hypothetical protein M1829_001568 [Trizodia sp. TS-e1964]|nr:MAG: hypothetical protein M1829_001568 [Trizodia sp. TS-e1964]
MKISAFSLAILVSSYSGLCHAEFVIDGDCKNPDHYKDVLAATEEVVSMSDKAMTRLVKKDKVAMNLYHALFDTSRPVYVEDALSKLELIPGLNTKVHISCTEGALQANTWDPNSRAKTIDTITNVEVKVKPAEFGAETSPCTQYHGPEAYTTSSEDIVHVILCQRAFSQPKFDQRSIQTILQDGPKKDMDLSNIRPLSYIILTQLLPTHIIRDSTSPAMQKIAETFEECVTLVADDALLNPDSYGLLATGRSSVNASFMSSRF